MLEDPALPRASYLRVDELLWLRELREARSRLGA